VLEGHHSWLRWLPSSAAGRESDQRSPGLHFFSKEKPDFWLIFKEELSGTTAFFSQRKRHSESAPKLFRAFFFARSSRRLRKKDIGIWFLLCCFFAVVGRNINNEGSVLPPYSKLIAAERAFSEFCTHNSS